MSLCVSLNSTTLDQLQADYATAMARGADLVEVRLDLLAEDQQQRLGELEAWIRDHASTLVFTCRPIDQGGQFEGHLADRLTTLLWTASLRPRYVDFEYTYSAQNQAVADKVSLMSSGTARDRWDGVILSEHHPDGRPATLQRKFLDMSGSPAEVIKLVWRARSAIDNFEVFDLLRSEPRPASVFCLGDDGLCSRVLGKKFGCAVTYCALHEGGETAAGQMVMGELLDLYRWRSIDEDTVVYGLIGSPVSHSLSPHIYNAALAECGLNAVYLPFRVDADGFSFADFVKAVAERPWLGIQGFSVTTPHKHHAWLLAEEELDPISRRIEAVNTLRFAEGSVTGTNTDYQAAIQWLTRGLGCELADLADLRVDLLGAGGFARAAVAALRVLKADVVVHNRSLERAEALADAFGCQARPLQPDTIFAGDLLINCTTVGMWPNVTEAPVRPEQLNPASAVFDAVYNPQDTQLLKIARERGCRVFGGLELFIDQAVLQFTALTGRIAPRATMRAVALAGGQAASRSSSSSTI